MRTSGNPALNLWEKVMEEVHAGLENKKFPVPSGLSSVQYCLDSGLRATEYCALDPRGSRVSSDSVFQGDASGEVCTIHTAQSVVKVCLDCPILKEDGSETGMYHIAGPYCPEESQKEMCLPDYVRERIGTAVAQDELYRKSVVESYGPCTLHTESVVEPPPAVEPGGPDSSGHPTDPEDPDHGDQSVPDGSGNGSGSAGTGTGEEVPGSQDIW